jgi:hydroxyacylglutathione hydrolase
VHQLSGIPGATAILLDTRPWTDFAAAHVPGSVHIALSGQFASWAGTLIGLESPVVLIAEDADRIEESRLRLARVGIERVEGFLDGGIEAWQRSGRPLAQIAQISVGELHDRIAGGEEIQIMDVRRPAEWERGHIAHAGLKPLGKFADTLARASGAEGKLLADLDRTLPVVVHCQSGYRSAIAASLLERAGFPAVVNVLGGFDAWKAQKLPVEFSALETSVSSTAQADKIS